LSVISLTRHARRARRIIVRGFAGMLTLLGLFVVACAGPPSAPRSLPPDTPVVPQGLDGRLLYTHDAGLWTLNLASDRTTQIITPPELGQVNSARWSPDGQRVAYALYEVRDRRVPISEIYVTDASGNDPQKIVSAQEAATFYQNPAWGPDGSIYILHTATNSNQRIRQIERIDPGTGDTSVVIQEPGQFDVSPDGQWLALAKTTEADMSLLLVNLQSGAQTEIVPARAFQIISAPRFDPTSKTVLFSAAGPASGIGQAEPANPLARLFDVSTAYAHGLPQALWSVPVAGGAVSSVAKIQLDEPVGAWSPDGSRFMVLSSEALWEVAPGTTSPKQILTPGAYGSVDWMG
jgi:Tol biopolymer transport system component